MQEPLTDRRLNNGKNVAHVNAIATQARLDRPRKILEACRSQPRTLKELGKLCGVQKECVRSQVQAMTNAGQLLTFREGGSTPALWYTPDCPCPPQPRSRPAHREPLSFSTPVEKQVISFIESQGNVVNSVILLRNRETSWLQAIESLIESGRLIRTVDRRSGRSITTYQLTGSVKCNK